MKILKASCLFLVLCGMAQAAKVVVTHYSGTANAKLQAYVYTTNPGTGMPPSPPSNNFIGGGAMIDSQSQLVDNIYYLPVSHATKIVVGASYNYQVRTGTVTDSTMTAGTQQMSGTVLGSAD